MKYKKLIIPEDTAWDRSLKWYNFITKIKINIKNDKIYNFLDKILFTPHSKFKNGIKNLINWVPIIWEDRNWDYSFIYSILEKKLDLTRHELISANRHMGIDDTNKYMTICLNLIDRVKNDYYGWEYLNYIKEDIKFVPYKRESNEIEDELFEGDKNDEEYFTMETIFLENNLDKYFALHPAAFKRFLKTDKVKNLNLETDSKIIAIHFSNYNRDRARKLLFNVLEYKIDSFWD